MSSSRQAGARSRPSGAGGNRDPPSAGLPGLHPAHDGSYGVNTHMNINSIGNKRRGKKPRAGPINEDEEDKRFKRQIRGKDGKRYNMENDLKKVVDQTKQEAKKDSKDDDEPEQPEDEEEIERDASEPMDQDGPPPPGGQQDNSKKTGKQQKPRTSGKRTQQGGKPESQPQNRPANPRYPNDDENEDGFLAPIDSYIPTYGLAFPDDPDNREKPPYRTVRYRSSDPYSLIHNKQPSGTALIQTSSFYGIPTGLGSSFENTRPSSSRSFIAENSLYGDATLRTPLPNPDPDPAPAPDSAKTSSAPPSGHPDSSDATTRATAGGGVPPPGRRGGVPPPGRRPGGKLPMVRANGDGGNPDSNINPPPNNPPPAGTGSQFGSDRRPTYGDGILTTGKPPGMKLDDWRRVQHVIQGMRPEGEQESSDDSPAPNVSKLTLSEIVESKALIADMHFDPMERARLIKALDQAAKTAAHEEPEKRRPFPNVAHTQRPDVDGIPGVNTIDFGANGTNINSISNNWYGGDNTHFESDDDADNEDNEDNDDGMIEYWDPVERRNIRAAPKPNRRHRSSWNLGNLNNCGNMFLLFLAILTLVWGVLAIFTHESPGFPLAESNIVPSMNIPSWHDVVDRVCGIIPCKNPIPPINWGSDKGPLVESLTPKIPEKVFVEKDKNGKPKITQDFWHALKQLIKEDDIILTLETAKKDGLDISDTLWLAIKSRLERGGYGARHGHTGVGQSWNNWLKQNQDSLKKMISGIAISRDEFMTLFEKETQSHQKEIRKELVAHDARIKELVDTVTKLQNSATGSSGLTKQEVKAISDAAVQKAIQNAKLDAVATGRIRGHANDMFINQVNFFGIGSGAVIDTHYTSIPWKPSKDYFKHRSKNWYSRDGYVNLPPTAAVSPWFEEGECYCAGRVVRGEAQTTNAISVLISRHIIPQHLVVEHILPGSTLDPESMPKDIEVWAYIEEVTLRDEVRAFSESHFPSNEEEKTLNEGYVKIGHFVYENKNYGDGVQIFKISDELTSMKASSNQIVVRAVSNYGADHTCFYRLKLYGDVVETTPWVEWNGRE
ncbi:hypothetical protein F5Y13DRAFT_202388 [Hypoxylon sp. FL1857]|nr:hypothetical protein F5Y13DRAFT_202388 [Hypoxylon sp. FL1857]